MKNTLALVLLVASGLTLGGAVTAADTGESKPKPPAATERKSKPPVCEWVCIKWNDNGSCANQEYRCN